ncbi:hypothetical protein [Allorhizobium terrae]|nr:hypothetical protein [Allorhizobium terrae]
MQGLRPAEKMDLMRPTSGPKIGDHNKNGTETIMVTSAVTA